MSLCDLFKSKSPYLVRWTQYHSPRYRDLCDLDNLGSSVKARKSTVVMARNDQHAIRIVRKESEKGWRWGNSFSAKPCKQSECRW